MHTVRGMGPQYNALLAQSQSPPHTPPTPYYIILYVPKRDDGFEMADLPQQGYFELGSKSVRTPFEKKFENFPFLQIQQSRGYFELPSDPVRTGFEPRHILANLTKQGLVRTPPKSV